MDSRVALDTDALRRLIAALASESPSEPDPESVALVRIYFYITTPLVVPTVSAEIEERGDLTELKWRDYHFNEVSHPDDFYKGCAKEQANTYVEYHPDPRDCRVVAEAECAKVEAFLTLKQPLIDGLGGRAESILVTKPSDYWARAQPPPGTAPRIQPGFGILLDGVGWWRR